MRKRTIFYSGKPSRIRQLSAGLAAVMLLHPAVVTVFAQEESLQNIVEGTIDEIESLYMEEWFENLDVRNMEEAGQGTWQALVGGISLWLPEHWMEIPITSEFTDPYVIFQASDTQFRYSIQVLRADLLEMYGLSDAYYMEDDFSEEEDTTSWFGGEYDEDPEMEDVLQVLSQLYTEVKFISCNGSEAVGVVYEDENDPSANLLGVILPDEDSWMMHFLILTPSQGEDLDEDARNIFSSFGAAGENKADTIELSEETPVRAIRSMGIPPFSGKMEVRYTCDSTGLLLTESVYDSEQVLLSENRYTYDEAGNPVSQTIWNQQGEEETTFFENTYEGNLLTGIAVYLQKDSDRLLKETVSCLYEGDVLVGREIQNPDGAQTKTEEYLYDEAGRLIQITRKDGDGQTGLTDEYTYDRDGRKQLHVRLMDQDPMYYESYLYE